MDSTIAAFLPRITLHSTPQQAFEHADALFLQAAQLAQITACDGSQREVLNQRANILTTTASGLQVIAKQNRDGIQYLLDRALEIFQDLIEAYQLEPRKATRVKEIKDRVEDGMATLEELEAFLEDVHNWAGSDRMQRELAPEPESPPSPSSPRPSVESNHSDLIHNQRRYTLKRKVSTIIGDDNATYEAEEEGQRVILRSPDIFEQPDMRSSEHGGSHNEANVSSFEHPVPDLQANEIELPSNIRTVEVIRTIRRCRKRKRREVKD